MQKQSRNGWQRLAIVLSVLWAVGVPQAAVMSQNSHVDDDLQLCRAVAFNPNFNLSSDGQEKITAECQRTALASYTSLSKMWVDDPKGRQALPYIIGIPILALWVIGGAVIGTVRWVAHGFTRH